MHERLLDKNVMPDETIIHQHLGDESCKRLADMEHRLHEMDMNMLHMEKVKKER